MPDNKSISQLTTAEQLSQSDLFETSIPNGSLGYLSRKASLEAIANFIANNLNYSDLQTVAKTLIGAINEAASGGGGGASIEEMTQAEYNALTPEQKADGTLRAISDATTSISDIDDVNVSSPADGDILAYDSTSSKWVNKELEADAIDYDNTSSGLNATDVNAAIDEVNAKTGSDIAVSSSSSETIAEALSALFLINTYTATVTVGANGVTALKGQDMGYNSIPSGYTPIVYSFSCVNSNDLFFNLSLLTATGSQQFGVIRNVSANPQNDKNCTIKITFIKSAFL